MIHFRSLCLRVILCMAAAPAQLSAQNNEESTMIQIRFIAGDHVLSATLDDTAAARDFAGMLPLELELTHYHNTELVADLGRKLDQTGMPDSYEPKTGDITQYAPWGNLAIFYKPFERSRGLIRLGAFDGSLDPLLDQGPVSVRIELAE